METVAIFTAFAENHRYLGYLILFLGMIAEGEVILMAAGILVNVGALALTETFFVAFFGVLANDIIWYGLGAHLKNKYCEKKMIRRAEAKVRAILPHLEKNPIKAIFISKFIAGINHPTLLLLGFLKIDFGFFMRHQLWASLLWTLTFLSLGVTFGYAAISYSHRLKEFVFVAILLLVIAMLVDKIIKLTVQGREK
jgi:membrane protein DedA with SNARE-associated domain